MGKVLRCGVALSALFLVACSRRPGDPADYSTGDWWSSNNWSNSNLDTQSCGDEGGGGRGAQPPNHDGGYTNPGITAGGVPWGRPPAGGR
jgi:hypothetical protein